MAGEIGIMQGRLSEAVGNAIQAFPVSTWQNEFARARQIEARQIEWIVGVEDCLNPIWSPGGVAEILHLREASGVQVLSLCADYFMSQRLLHGTADERSSRQQKLITLVSQCGAVRIKRLVLPFVDHSGIGRDAEVAQLSDLVRSLLPILHQHGVELHLETSLPPRPFAALLSGIDSPWLKANYDTGNSAALGFQPDEEFAAYGRWIGSVHIKDRLKDGGTVPLGRGHVNFARIVHLLRKVGYEGDFTLQVARDKPGDELEWCRKNLQYWQTLWREGR